MELRAPSKIFIEQAKAWHEDEQLNQATGFGRGASGQQMAQRSLDMMLETEPRNMRLLGVWDGEEPVGYVVFTDLDGINKTGDLHLTISPKHQGKGYGARALRAAVDIGMEDGLYRITFCPIISNRAAISVGYKAGFKREALTKFSIWTVDGPQDQLQMRIIKPEWKRRALRKDE